MVWYLSGRRRLSETQDTGAETLPSRAHSARALARRVWTFIVEPFPSVTDPLERQDGRLLASMLAMLGVFVVSVLVVWATAPGKTVAGVEAVIAGVAVPLLTAGYVLARSGRARSAGWIIVVGGSGIVFAQSLTALAGLNPLYRPHDAMALVYIVMPLYVAGAVLRRRDLVGMAAVIVAGALAVPLAFPVVRYDELLPGPVLLVTITAVLLIVFSAHREQLERHRSAMMREEITERTRAQEELKRHHDELEELVAERTAVLEAAMAELVEANEAKSRFLAAMSHELRTPLNSVIGFTGVIRQGLAGPVTPEQERQLSMVDRSSRHLLGLIDQVLDLSRIESGTDTLVRDTFLIDELLWEVREALDPLAGAKGLKLVVTNVDLGDRNTMVADRSKLRQVLLNLAGNAIKFTDHGRVALSASVFGDLMRLTVTDTGVGIAPTDRESVFEAYHQVPGTAGGKPEGTGLGLALSRRIAQLLGGDIELDSEVGVGSRFTVTIPQS
jgi:signal transduction histidine kinase